LQSCVCGGDLGLSSLLDDRHAKFGMVVDLKLIAVGLDGR
jgi:hypothetical protein